MASELGNKYYDYRQVDVSAYQGFRVPLSIVKVLPADKQAEIFEVGCGFGQILIALRDLGYARLAGIDLSQQAVAYCCSKGLNVLQADLLEHIKHPQKKFNFIIMSHVLEHIPKGSIIEVLSLIKQGLLTENGKLLVVVPNAQAETGCYWRYEDFTHTTVFTSGSLYYVLKAAGFENIEFIDPDCLEGLSPFKKALKTTLLLLYKLNKELWRRVTTSAYHRASPQIFSCEIKALAS